MSRKNLCNKERVKERKGIESLKEHLLQTEYLLELLALFLMGFQMYTVLSTLVFRTYFNYSFTVIKTFRFSTSQLITI